MLEWCRLAKRRFHARRPTRTILPLGLLASLALVLASGTLLAAGAPSGVKGRVTGWEKLLPQVYADVAKADSHRFTWREPSPTVKQDFRKLSANVTRDVCVAAFGGGPAQPHASKALKVTGGRITPSTIVISPGSTRDWVAGPAGVHVIRDMLFPSVVMYIVVDANAVEFDFPDRDGAFSMSLAPGDYTLKAFFDGKPTGKPIDGVKIDAKGLELKEPLAVGSN